MVLRRQSLRGSSWQGRRGFTLVELVIVILVVAILGALAAPAFQSFIRQQRIRTATYDLISDLSFARSEATKRSATVTMSKAGTWTGGWTITDAGGTTLRTHPAFASEIIITMGSSSIAFSLDGRASPASSFSVDDTAGSASVPIRYVCVDVSGRARSSDASCT